MVLVLYKERDQYRSKHDMLIDNTERFGVLVVIGLRIEVMENITCDLGDCALGMFSNKGGRT